MVFSCSSHYRPWIKISGLIFMNRHITCWVLLCYRKESIVKELKNWKRYDIFLFNIVSADYICEFNCLQTIVPLPSNLITYNWLTGFDILLIRRILYFFVIWSIEETMGKYSSGRFRYDNMGRSFIFLRNHSSDFSLGLQPVLNAQVSQRANPGQFCSLSIVTLLGVLLMLT